MFLTDVQVGLLKILFLFEFLYLCDEYRRQKWEKGIPAPAAPTAKPLSQYQQTAPQASCQQPSGAEELVAIQGATIGMDEAAEVARPAAATGAPIMAPGAANSAAGAPAGESMTGLKENIPWTYF